VIVIAAHFEPDFPLDCGRMFERELELSFAIGDPTNHRMRLLDMLAAGAVDPMPAVTHRFGLADAAEAYAVFDRREAIKVFLQP
jgi:threonine dehydrogenase-like Zn-dependent dehydrogenase